MDNFPLPPKHSSPSGQPNPMVPGLPPRHKIKPEPEANASSSENEEDAEAQLQRMLDEEYPVIEDKPPHCDWHLDALMSGDYPDPFSLPALEFGKQIVLHDMAAFME